MRRVRQTLESKLHRIKPSWASIAVQGDRVLIRCSQCHCADSTCIRRLSALLAAVIRPEVRTVELDLRDIEDADTQFVAGLVFALRLARKRDVSLILHTSAYLQNLIHVLRLDGLMAAAE